jgi:hypothetical protein
MDIQVTGWSGFNYDTGLPRERLKEMLLHLAENDIRAMRFITSLVARAQGARAHGAPDASGLREALL